MDTSTLTTILTDSGFAGIVLLLVVFGYLVPKPTVDKLESEKDYYRNALDLERQRNGEMASTGTVTNQLLSAFVHVATENREIRAADGQTRQHDPAGTWKDLA